MSEPDVYYTTSLAISDSFEGAKCWTPRSDWKEIKAYVEKSAYDELKRDAEKLVEAVEKISAGDYSGYTIAKKALEEWRAKWGESKEPE